nr:MAG TPA: hypothetical protein [Caudoviricetes sp.]
MRPTGHTSARYIYVRQGVPFTGSVLLFLCGNRQCL